MLADASATAETQPLACLDVSSILIADDEPEVRRVLGRLMAEDGHVCTFAADGSEVLRIAQETAPDLVLLDVQMPLVSGLDALVALRKDERTCATPVILLSAGARPVGAGGEALASVDEFVAKPFEPERLLSLARAVLRRVRGEGPRRGSDSAPLAVLTFDLAGERCALPASDVVEVVRAAFPARLPKAPAVVAGVLNVRGGLVPLLDLRRRFGLPPRPLSSDDHTIIASAAGRVVAFAVERVLDLVEIPAAEINATAEVAAGAEHLAGIARLPDGLLVIYDLHEFLSADEAVGLDRSLAEAQTS